MAHASAQAVGEELFGHGMERDPVGGPHKAVSLVGVEHVGRGDPPRLQRSDGAFALARLDTRVPGTLADQ